MKFSHLSHPLISVLLFITYVGGAFLWCSPHHAYATEENTITIENDDGHLHSHKNVSSSQDENNSDSEKDDHCKEWNLMGVDVYIHKDFFHSLAQVDTLANFHVPFFMVQEKNDAYFYREWVGIYKKQLYDSEVAYASERKNIIEVLI